MAPFEHRNHARKPGTLVLLGAIYAGLAGLVFIVDAAPWLMAALALPTLPALRDFWRDHASGLRLDDATLSWFSGTRSGEVALARIVKVRFDRRFDFSTRVSVVTGKGRPLRLPPEALGRVSDLATALQARGVAVEHNPFSIL